MAAEVVLDIDEDQPRDNRLEADLQGFSWCPVCNGCSGQGGPHRRRAHGEQTRSGGCLRLDDMEADRTLSARSGTTVAAIAEALGVEKTCWAIDALLDGKVEEHDLNEREILAQLDGHERCAIVVTRWAATASSSGRDPMAVAPEVIRRVG